MRTKTLLVAAAALSAGLLASSAQVYSVNTVGYINLTLTPGFNLICNQLTNGNNNINIALTNGALDGMTIQSFTGTTFGAADQYYADPGAWFDGDLNPSATILVPGKGYMLFNPSSSSVTMTLLGDVPQGTTVTPVASGFNFLGSVPPVVSGLSTNGFPNVEGATYQTFNGTAYSSALQYYADAGGWFDGDLNPVDPAPAVSKGFIVFNPGPLASWTRTFTVTP